ncbi:MAG TPA: hypothetical protein VFZ08_06975, partial [Terriglobia bacterium]|nr:hypothetical protein [Terriglobia bacterium]
SLAAAFKAIGNGGGRCGLLLPDLAMRVNVLNFETLPQKSKEREALIRWRIKESLGFAPEESRISWQVLHTQPGLIELLVVAAKNDVLAEYEAALDSRSGISLILPVTCALLPLLPDTERGGQILTHVCSGGVTHAVVEGKRLRLWRSRRLAQPELDGGAAEVISEAARAAASARDRLKLQITKAWLCTRPLRGDEFRNALERELGLPVENLAWDGNLGNALDPGEKPLFHPFGAPVAGLIANSGRSL